MARLGQPRGRGIAEGRSESESKRVTGTAGRKAAARASGIEMSRWSAGTAAAEEAVPDVMIKPPLSCVRQ